MVADETALILVLPGDTSDTLLQKMKQSGARRVQLLVPEGVAGLQQRPQLEHLHTLAVRQRIELTLISSDQRTLQAARLGGIETLEVEDAHVVAPAQSPPTKPAPNRGLGHEPARDSVPHHIADDLSAGDAAFLDALDDLDAMPSSRNVDVAPEDADLFAALESLSAPARPSNRGAPSADDDFADALDSIGVDEEELRSTSPRSSATPPAAPRRIRPEDIELSAEEKARATQTGRRTATPTPPRPERGTPTPAASGRRSSIYDEESAPPLRPRPRQQVLIPALIALILLAAVAVAAFMFMGNGVTVRVSPPVRSEELEPISALPVPLVALGSASTTAVEAESITSEVAVNVSGQITETTMAPSGTARGTVTLYNSNTQAVTLPAGSEFIAVKPDGQEVPFVSGIDITMPPAVTTDQGAQIVTTRGLATVEVSARSAGSGSNVDANSISRIVVPGGQTFSVNSGSLLVQHGPLSGGSEDQVRIVKDSDVQVLLAQGLAQLEAQALQQLQGIATTRGLQLETTTLMPRRIDLEQIQGVSYIVSPDIGQTVDPLNPTFTVTIQAHYSALITPLGTQIQQQLGAALTEELRQMGLLKPGDCKAPAITGWVWNGERLMIDGHIGPNTSDPACGPGISDATLQQVRAAIRGKSRAEAEIALKALQEQGLIGTYVLPDVQQLPGWDFQLHVESR